MIKSLAVLAIATLTLASCGGKDKEVKETTPAKVKEVKTGSLKIAFYNQDTLKSQFKYYKEQDEYVKNKQLKFQAELDRMTKDYQGYVRRNEERAQQGLLSQNQLQEIGQQVQLKEKKIMDYERSQGQKLEKETVELLEGISKKLDSYSKMFCEKNKIDILLIQAPGGQIGYIVPKMDVTDEYIEFLNAQEESIKEDLEK